MNDTTNPSDIPIVNEIAEATYPHRKSFFGMSYLRLVSKCNAGQAIGPAGIALLTIVVTTEDQLQYRRAVDFFDDQLTPMLGLSSRKTLGVTRRKCVEEKWLHYKSGQKRRPGKYWVTIPPEFQGTPDYSDDATKMIDDTTGVKFTQEQNRIDSEKGIESTQERVQDRLRKGYTTIPTPIPTPTPIEEREEHRREDAPAPENDSVKKQKSNRMKRPTVDEVREFCREHQLGIDAEAFMLHYESNGWKIGKNPMVNWTAAARSWAKREPDNRMHHGGSQKPRILTMDEERARKPAGGRS